MRPNSATDVSMLITDSAGAVSGTVNQGIFYSTGELQKLLDSGAGYAECA